MSVSILVVDDEPDVAELFRQRFRHEVRQGLYVLHFAHSGDAALAMLGDGIRPELISWLERAAALCGTRAAGNAKEGGATWLSMADRIAAGRVMRRRRRR